MSPKPTAADIIVACGKIAADDWLDPADAPPHWLCVVYDEKGARTCAGEAHEAAEAMALAWIGAWDNDALVRGHVDLGAVPMTVPDGWRFELTENYKYEAGGK
jgi:hypothetical protein